MMLYTFYLVVHLLAAQHCAVWTSEYTPANIRAACGVTDLGNYDLVLYDLAGNEVCKPLNVYTRAGCNLTEPLDHYRLIAYTRPVDTTACVAITEHNPATYADFSDCPPWAADAWQEGRARIQYISEQPKPSPAPLCPRPEIPHGPGLFEQVNSAAELATDENLYLLAGRLIWHGYVTPNCPGGYSGIDAVTLSATTCGMETSKNQVIRWQNRFDEAIYEAAIAQNVPARLLKTILMRETQFWTIPAPGGAGEIGPYQITDAGLDTLLRYTDPAYAGQHQDRQFYARALVRDGLKCDYCTIPQADTHLRANMQIYAALLASYRCQTNADWPEAARAWNIVYSDLSP